MSDTTEQYRRVRSFYDSLTAERKPAGLDPFSREGFAFYGYSAFSARWAEAEALAGAPGAEAPLHSTPTDGSTSRSTQQRLPKTPGAVEARARATWDNDAALRASFGGLYDAYLAAEKAEASGKVSYRPVERAE